MRRSAGELPQHVSAKAREFVGRGVRVAGVGYDLGAGEVWEMFCLVAAWWYISIAMLL
jgi:hypothetical protein